MIISVFVSALGLSMFLTVRLSLADVAMMLVAPTVTILLMPRRDWLRVMAYVFLMAGIYGLGRIAAEIARSTLEFAPLARSWGRFGFEASIYGLYAAIWGIWWLSTERGKREGLIRKRQTGK